MVGSNLAEFFKKDFKVVGTYYKNRVTIPEVLTIPCDILVKTEIKTVLHTFRPDYTIYAIGTSSINEAHAHENVTKAINNTGLFHVTDFCQRYKSQICYISSCYVFEGDNKNYVEIDIPDATTILGKAQATSEFYVQQNSLNYLVFRCSKLYGRSISPAVSSRLFESLQNKINRGKQVNYDDHLKIGFLDVYYLGMIMKMCFEKGTMNRLLQVSSKDSLTHYNFAQEYCKTFGHSPEKVLKVKWPFPIAKNQSFPNSLFFGLDITNVESFLNIVVPSVRESLEFTYRRFHGTLLDSKQNMDKNGGELTYI